MARHTHSGFSLLEMLIVIGIMIAVAGLTVPYLQSFQVDSDTRTYADSVTHALRRAQQFARTGQAGQAGLGWGFHINPSAHEYTVFHGTSYASRDSAYDQVTAYSETITLTTDFGDDVIFTIFSGTASANGTVSVIGADGDTHDILITAYGTIIQAE